MIPSRLLQKRLEKTSGQEGCNGKKDVLDIQVELYPNKKRHGHEFEKHLSKITKLEGERKNMKMAKT